MASQKGDKNLSNINENERSRITPSGNKRQLSYEQLYQGGGNHNPQGYSHDHGRQNMQQMLEFISQHGGAYGATKPSDQYLQQIQQHQDTSNLMGGFIEPDSAVSFYSDLSITHQNQKDILNVGVQDQIDYISQHIQHNYFHEPTPEEFLRELEKNEVTGPIIKDRFQKIIKDIQRNPSFADINDPSAKKEAFQRFNNDPVVSSLVDNPN